VGREVDASNDQPRVAGAFWTSAATLLASKAKYGVHGLYNESGLYLERSIARDTILLNNWGWEYGKEKGTLGCGNDR
jgi:hypothetical protein